MVFFSPVGISLDGYPFTELISPDCKLLPCFEAIIQPEESSYSLAHVTIGNVKIFFLNASDMKNSTLLVM